MTALSHMTTFRARLTLRWTVAVGLLLGVTNLSIYFSADFYLHRWLDSNLRTVAATEAASSTDGPVGVHLHEDPLSQLQTGAFTEKLVQIFDESGNLVLQSTALGDSSPVVSLATVQEALSGRMPIVSTTMFDRPVRVAVITASRGAQDYAVAVGLFADDVEQGLLHLTWLLGAIWTVGLAATGGIGYVLASRALAPVARITERAAWIARGNFDARLDTPLIDDELGRMTVLLNSMLDRLREALETNRRFASDASHELRGPLTSMAGELEVALRHPRSADSYRDTLTHVRGRLAALTQLAEDLILLARAQEGTGTVTLREVDLDRLVDESFRRLQDTAAAKSVTLDRDSLKGVYIYADPALMARVIDNTVANAVHYNRDGGRVHVTAHLEEPPPDAWASPTVQIEVRDTGGGIPPDKHERIFERFFRLDSSRARHTGGSGLGLAISREVLALQSATIRVGASSPDGTTIEIRIPGRGPLPAASSPAETAIAG